MKAKEYATALLAEIDAAFHADLPIADKMKKVHMSIATVIQRLLAEAGETVRERNLCQEAALAGAIRERYQKWQAICRIVVAKYPNVPVTEEFFCVYLANASIESFVLCMDHNAFLGYVPQPVEAKLLSEFKQGYSRSAFPNLSVG